MLGRSHCLCGLIFGCVVAAALPHAPLPVRLLAVPVAGGAALLPDIDHPSSRVARSLGIVTRVIAVGVAAVSLAVYHATRDERDPPDRRSGHRTLTHTVPGAAAFGVMTLVAVAVHPAAGTVWLALLVGLMAQGFKSIGTGFTLAAAGGAWWTLTYCPGWWWLWPALVTLGSVVHVLGDWSTNSGVPLRWPLRREGRRWELTRAPVTFATGSAFETEAVTPILVGSLVVAGGFASGVAPALIAAWVG